MKFGRIAGRIDDAGLASPQLVDVTFGPRRIDHDLLTERADQTIEPGEKVVVDEFALGESRVVGHDARMVEGALPFPDAIQHVRRYRRVMDVRGH